jgi:hypothetical protein
MYDVEALYIGADVNDPSPMMNMRGPSTDPFQAWNADSCQFRLTVDPAVGYPKDSPVNGTSAPVFRLMSDS